MRTLHKTQIAAVSGAGLLGTLGQATGTVATGLFQAGKGIAQATGTVVKPITTGLFRFLF